jgi:hypothetical protein
MSERCTATHWFGTDRIGETQQCVVVGEHGRHEDAQGRWWETIATQPRPRPTNGPAIVDLVIEDLRGRDRLGVRKYGTRLQANNGRDALQDAYEEVLDLAQYMKQCIEEREHAHALLERALAAAERGSNWIGSTHIRVDDAEHKRVSDEIQAIVDAVRTDVARFGGPMTTDDDSRCAVCGWPLVMSLEDGCIRGNCSMRPRPERLYAPERAKKERP